MGVINLNERQKEAVEHKEGPLLIIAGAGTGKTAVITQRILHIINNNWAKSDEILALTFTDKAAEEMLERVDQNMPLSYGDIWISTFHAFCDRILRQEGHYIGLDTNYSMMTAAESYIFFRKHLFDMPLDKFRPKGNPTRFIDDILKHFSRLQDEDVSTEQYLEFANGLPKGSDAEKEDYEDVNELAKVYERYTELKIENSKIDFGDLIILTIKLFREKPNLLEKYRKKFKYILVDEFQDTNYTQSVLVNILAGLDPIDGKKDVGKISPNLTVVGDDDQAIYKFRGAAISNILQFKEYYPMAKEVVLVENYRSKQEILDASYALIRNNDPYRLEVTEKIEKKLMARGTFSDDGDAVNLVTAVSEDAEAEWIAKEIVRLTGFGKSEMVGTAQKYDEKGQSALLDSDDNGGYSFKDIAILVRANAHSEAIVQNLKYLGVPYKMGGSRGLYFRSEIKRLISFLRLMVDYTDEISMFNLLMMDEWGVSGREFVELNRLAREENLSVFEMLEKLWSVKIGEEEEVEILESNLLESMFSDDAKEGVNKFLGILNVCVKMVRDEKSVGELLYYFVTESGYIENLVHEDSSESQFMVSNISKFFDLIKDYEKNNVDTNIYEYVDYLNYSIDVGDSPLVDHTDLADYDAVSIMTVHGSKGLEFPVVFLANLVGDRFPSRNRKDSIPIHEGLIKEALSDLSSSEEHLQEERRLFYVGATRAKEKLYLTAANFYGNAKRKKKATVFLYELLDRDVSEEFDNPMIKKDEEGNVLDVMESVEESVNGLDLSDIKVKRVSYSQVNTYDMCPKKYKYGYLLRIPTKANAALSFGSSVHNALNDFYSLLIKSKEGLGITEPPTLKELIELFDKHWISVGYQSKKHEEDRRESGYKLLDKYYNDLYSVDQKPFRLEEGFSVHVGDVTFSGKIDRMDLIEMDGDVPVVEIVDYKTGKVKSDSDLKNDLQLPLYSIFAEKALGVKVRGAKYIFVEHGVEIEVDVSDGRRAKSEVELLEMINNMKSGNFEADPGFHCQFCDYRDICEDAAL